MFTPIRHLIRLVLILVVTGTLLASFGPTSSTHAAPPPPKAAVQTLLKEAALAVAPCVRAQTTLRTDRQAFAPPHSGASASPHPDAARTQRDAARLASACAQAARALRVLTIPASLHSDPATQRFKQDLIRYAAAWADFGTRVERASLRIRQ